MIEKNIKQFALLAIAIIMAAGIAVLVLWPKPVSTAPNSYLAPPFPVPPAFEGEPRTMIMKRDDLSNKRTVMIAPDGGDGWTTVFSDTFESPLDPTYWTSTDENGFPEYKWGSTTYTNTTISGTRSLWAVGAGVDGALLDPTTDGYPDDADSQLVLGPIDMQNAVQAMITFNYWLFTDSGDQFGVWATADLDNTGAWTGLINDGNGGDGGPFAASFDLNDYAGESEVYVIFTFITNEDGPTTKAGAFLDDFALHTLSPSKGYLPYVAQLPTLTPTNTPTPTPTPTATPSLQGEYRDDFDDPESGWEMRRTTTDDYELTYRSDEQYQIEIGEVDKFLITSPMGQSPEPPYEIEVEALFADPRDKHSFSIIFGGDLEEGEECPVEDYTSCFNTYYQFQVTYRDNDDGGDQYLETRVKRIDSHDNNGEPEGTTFIATFNPNDVSGADVDANTFNVWKVRVEEDGDVKIYANDTKIGQERDDDLVGLEDYYFGLAGYTGGRDGLRVKFKYFDVAEGE